MYIRMKNMTAEKKIGECVLHLVLENRSYYKKEKKALSVLIIE